LAVTGQVEKFAEIRPERIYLAGPAGVSLFAEVEIIPRKEYPFTITDIKAKNGANIRYDLTERCTGPNRRCTIRLENTLAEKGNYVDVLYVLTDSQLRPQIPIYVVGRIQ